MTRGTLPAGFQLALPNSGPINAPADKAQDGQHHGAQLNSSPQQDNHQKGQHQSTQTPTSASHTKNTASPSSGNAQQHQQLQMQNNNYHLSQPAFGNSPHQQYHQAMMSQMNGINQQNVQPSQGQNTMIQGTPDGRNQLQQPLMSANNQNFEQPILSFPKINQQSPDSAQNQNSVAQVGINQQLSPEDTMFTNNFDLQAVQGNQLNNLQLLQTDLGYNMLDSNLLNAQQHQQGMMMPGNALTSPVSQDNMFNNNMLGQQGVMGAMTGMEQFQQVNELPSMIEKCVREVLAQGAGLQMVNQMASVQQQQQQQQPCVPVTPQNTSHPPYQADNQSVAPSLGG